MNLVADTNIFLAVALDEPEKEQIIEVTAGTRITAPEILPYEIGNALTAMVKRRQVTPEQALSALTSTSRIPVRLLAIDIRKALELAFEFNIYAYDAYFLLCAKTLGYRLITLDKRMRQTATELDIAVLELAQ